MAFEDRKYVIINTTDINKINFDEVLETAPETCRYSVDGAKTFVKYSGNMPYSILTLANKSIEYTHSEILTILNSEEWTNTEEII